MIDVLGMALLRPWWLLAVPVLAAAAFMAARRWRPSSAWTSAVQPQLLAALERLGRLQAGGAGRARGPHVAAIATAAIIAIALAGPAREAREGSTFRNLDAVVLVVDLSRSTATDGQFAEAKLAARAIAESAGTRAVALIVFAGDAYVASNFTTDAEVLGTTIAVLDGDTVPERGDRPERALALARRTLKDAHIVAADVVMVSAGGGIGDKALTEAEALAADGHRLAALYVPPAQSDAAPAQKGALEALIRASGGTLVDVRDPVAVVNDIATRHGSHLAGAAFTALIWSDYGRWLLLAALAPALMLFRRRA